MTVQDSLWTLDPALGEYFIGWKKRHIMGGICHGKRGTREAVIYSTHQLLHVTCLLFNYI